METTTVQRGHYCNQEERAQWVARYCSSALRPGQFAEQHGLKLGTLRRWIQQEGHRCLSKAGASETIFKNQSQKLTSKRRHA